jgi:hypothetical protein
VREKKLRRKKQKEEMPKHLAIKILYLSIFQPFSRSLTALGGAKSASFGQV